MKKDEWTLPELAEESRIPARTIRYYIARGLLPGPVVAGRSATYNSRHLERLQVIRKLQREGRMLAEIAQAPDHPDQSFPEPQAWWQYGVADGITVQVRADLAPWKVRRLRKALAELAPRLKKDGRGL